MSEQNITAEVRLKKVLETLPHGIYKKFMIRNMANVKPYCFLDLLLDVIDKNEKDFKNKVYVATNFIGVTYKGRS